jgi:hypothetical protein
MGLIFYAVHMDATAGTTPGTQEQAYFGDIEDRIFASELNDGVNWSASPMGFWTGRFSTSKAYGIEIRHLNAGVPTGKDFYLFMSGGSGTVAQTEPDEAFSTSVLTYFSVNSAGTDGFFGMYYNPFGISNPVQWGVTNRFDNPIQNPHTATAAFFNQPAAGIHRSRLTQFSENNPYPWGLLFNHDVPFVGFLYGFGYTSHIYGWHYNGDIFIPRDAGDPFVNGHVGIFTSPSVSDNDADIITCFGVDDLGAKQDYSLDAHQNFTRFNSPRSDGTYNADAIKLTNSSHDKGIIDPRVIAIQGVADLEFGQFFAGPEGPRMKMESRFAAVMPDDIAIPFIGYPGVFNPGFRS